MYRYACTAVVFFRDSLYCPDSDVIILYIALKSNLSAYDLSRVVLLFYV